MLLQLIFEIVHLVFLDLQPVVAEVVAEVAAEVVQLVPPLVIL
jgi:hypothetical protein